MANRMSENFLKNKSPLNYKAKAKTESKIRTQRNVMRSIWARIIQKKAERKLQARYNGPDYLLWFRHDGDHRLVGSSSYFAWCSTWALVR